MWELRRSSIRDAHGRALLCVSGRRAFQRCGLIYVSDYWCKGPLQLNVVSRVGSSNSWVRFDHFSCTLAS